MTTQANGGQGNGSGAGDGGNANGGAGGDNNANQNGNGDGNQNNQGGQQNNGNQGGDQNQNNGGEQLTEAQLAQAFQHPRFKELSQQAQELKTLKQKQADDEAEKLKQQGEHEKLAEQYKTQAEQNAAALKTERINNAVIVAASKLGAHDTAVVTKLVDSGKITVGDDGSITGVDDALKALQTSNPYLFKTGSQANIGGSDTNSNGQNANDATYSLSQFQDSAYYKEHQKEMDAAMTAGKVDMTR